MEHRLVVCIIFYSLVSVGNASTADHQTKEVSAEPSRARTTEVEELARELRKFEFSVRRKPSQLLKKAKWTEQDLALLNSTLEAPSVLRCEPDPKLAKRNFSNVQGEIRQRLIKQLGEDEEFKKAFTSVCKASAQELLKEGVENRSVSRVFEAAKLCPGSEASLEASYLLFQQAWDHGRRLEAAVYGQGLLQQLSLFPEKKHQALKAPVALAFKSVGLEAQSQRLRDELQAQLNQEERHSLKWGGIAFERVISQLKSHPIDHAKSISPWKEYYADKRFEAQAGKYAQETLEFAGKATLPKLDLPIPEEMQTMNHELGIKRALSLVGSAGAKMVQKSDQCWFWDDRSLADQLAHNGRDHDLLNERKEIVALGKYAVPWLEGLLSYDDPEVVDLGVNMLADIGLPHATRSVPVIAGLLHINYPYLKNVETAIEALGKFGESAISAIPSLVRRAAKYDGPLRYKTKTALKAMGPKAAKPLMELAKTASHSQRIFAIRMLGQFKSVGAVPVLADLLNDPNKFIRQCVAQALSGFGPRAESATEGLLKRLQVEEDQPTRSMLVYALGAIHQHPSQVIPVLHQLLQSDESSEVKRVAIHSIGNYGAAGRSTVSTIGKYLSEKQDDYVLGEAAARALGKVGGQEAAEILTKSLKFEFRFSEHLVDVLQALSALKQAVPKSVPALIEILGVDQDNDRVRPAAAEALGSVASAQQALPMLKKLLTDSNEKLDVRASAVAGLGKLGKDATSVLPEILAFYQEVKQVRDFATDDRKIKGAILQIMPDLVIPRRIP